MSAYHVWTVNSGARLTVTCLFSGTKIECKQWVLGRWGHHPPFAYVSAIKDIRKARKRFTGLNWNEDS